MRGRLRAAAGLLLVIVAVATFGRWSARAPVTAREQRVVAGMNQLGLNLLATLARQDPDANHLASPVSISAAWALLYAGSRGATADTLARSLYYPEPPESLGSSLAAVLGRLEATEFWGRFWRPRAELAIASGAFGTPGVFEPGYRELIQQQYGLRCEEALGSPSDAVARINAWAKSATRGRIPEVLTAADVPKYQDAVMLASAIYFKCNWLQQFPETQSLDDQDFLLEDGQSTKVRMMRSRTGSRFGYLSERDLQILQMPYLSAHPYSMVVLLPRTDVKLADIEKDLTLERLEDWLKRLSEQEVIVGFPRFTFQQAYDLQKPLEALGMSLAFRPQADFSALSRKPLNCLKSKHVTWIEVNERGTEAAAVTTSNDFVVGGGSVPYFRADHPFLFFIRDDETGCLMFVGRMMNPAAQGASEPRRI